jgi:hypothetical protein
MMQEIRHDGTTSPVELLRTGKEWEDINKALDNPKVREVRVFRIYEKKGVAAKRKRKRKMAKASRRRNR